jgi:hypothetical protein
LENVYVFAGVGDDAMFEAGVGVTRFSVNLTLELCVATSLPVAVGVVHVCQ